MQDITAKSLADKLASGQPPLVVDVREPWECEIARFAGALEIPMNTVPGRLDELRGRLGPDTELAILCHSGVRSRHVAQFLEHHGIAGVLNVAGGIDAWSCDVDPSIPRY